MEITQLSFDVFRMIAVNLKLDHIDSFRSVSKCIHSAIDDDFYRIYAEMEWGIEFWNRAMLRPEFESRPMTSWRDELIRIERFQRMVEFCEGKRWCDRQFYLLWSIKKNSPLPL